MTTEVWKDIIGWEGSYQVSDIGNVRSLDRVIENGRCKPYTIRGTVLKQKMSRCGYKSVTLQNAGTRVYPSVHRLVAKAFIPNQKDLPQVNHIDGNKENNTVSNLEWVTASENINHAFSIGLKPRGEGSPLTDLDEKVIHKVCEMLSEGYLNTEVVKTLGVTRDVVSKIKTGQSWKHITSLYPIPRKSRGLPENVVIRICELLQAGKTAQEVLDEMIEPDLTLAKIYSIRKRQYYTKISKNYNWKHRTPRKGKIRD